MSGGEGSGVRGQGSGRAVVDVRPEAEFLAGHAVGAVSIPLAELVSRVYELPPRDVPILVFDASPCRAGEAAELLRDRGWSAEALTELPLVETGPARIRLWRPNAFLADVISVPGEHKAALDIACGNGRDAVWLALRGCAVTAVDILPDAIQMAQGLARRNGVSIDARVLDTEREPLPDGPFDLVTCFSFLQRDLFGAIRERVRPGGAVVYETFLTAHRDKYGKPKRPEFLLQPGELPKFFDGWEIRRYDEGEFTPGRITARLHARKP